MDRFDPKTLTTEHYRAFLRILGKFAENGMLLPIVDLSPEAVRWLRACEVNFILKKAK